MWASDEGFQEIVEAILAQSVDVGAQNNVQCGVVAAIVICGQSFNRSPPDRMAKQL